MEAGQISASDARMTRVMKVVSSLLLAGAVFVLAPPSTARAQTTQRFEVWYSMPMTADIGDDVPGLQLWLDEHVRRGPDQTVHITRPGIGLRILDWMIVYLGYAWVPTFIDEPQTVRHEHRIWEQLIMNWSPIGEIAIQSRTRFEQRFSDSGDDVALRLRQFVRLLWKPEQTSPLAFVVWDEIFVGLTDSDWGPVIGYDQNRLFGGPALSIEDIARIEVGYMFNHLRREPINVIGHVLYTQLLVFI
jgi:hypothetical protein